MNKKEFLDALEESLQGIPRDERENRIEFYSEMIDDRIEDGICEEQAVNGIGSVDEIKKQVLADIPLSMLVKAKIKRERKIKPTELILIVLGSPIWISLICAAIAVIIAVYAVLWSVIISFWSVFVSFVASALGLTVGGAAYVVNDEALRGIGIIGIALVCGGLSVYSFQLCKAVTKGIIILTKKIAIVIKNCFVKKEAE